MRAEMRTEIKQIKDQLSQRGPGHVKHECADEARKPTTPANLDSAAEKRKRSVVFGPFPKDTKADAITQFINTVMKEQTDIEETFAYGKKFAERGAARFKNSESMWNFMRANAGSHTHDFQGVRIYCNPDSAARDADGEDATRERAIRKLVRAIIETKGSDGQAVKKDIDANYRKGVVWWQEVRVAEWSKVDQKLSFVVGHDEHADFQTAFDKLMLQE